MGASARVYLCIATLLCTLVIGGSPEPAYGSTGSDHSASSSVTLTRDASEGKATISDVTQDTARPTQHAIPTYEEYLAYVQSLRTTASIQRPSPTTTTELPSGSGRRADPSTGTGDAGAAASALAASYSGRYHLEQTVLKVTVKEFIPFIFMNSTMTGAPDSRPVGFTIDLWEEVAKRSGFRFVYTPVQGFSQLFDSVTVGDADLGLTGSTITKEREEVVDFSHIYYESGLRIVQRTSELQASFMESLFSPLFIQILATTAAVLVIVGHLMWLFERSMNSDFRPSYPVGAWDGIWWATVTISTVGYGDIKPRSSLGRGLAILWMFFGLVSTTLLLSVVVSSLTNFQKSGAIAEVGDLYGRSVGVVSNTTSASFVTVRLGADRVFQYPDALSGMWSLDRGQIEAFIFDDPVVTRHSRVVFSNRLTPVGDMFDPQPYGLMLRKDSPYLQTINAHLIDIKSSAFYTEALETWSLNKVEQPDTRSLSQSSTLLMVSLIVLGVVIFAVMLFGTFYTYQRHRHKNDLSEWAAQRLEITRYLSACQMEYPNMDRYGHVRLTLGGRNLPKMDTFGKSDPYVVVYAQDVLTKDKGKFTAVAQTEPHFYTRTPRWQRLTIPTYILTQGSLDSAVLLKVLDFNSVEEDEEIGTIETTTRDLLSGRDSYSLEGESAQTKSQQKIPEIIVFKAVQMTPPELPFVPPGLLTRHSGSESGDTSTLLESIEGVRRVLANVEDQLHRIETHALQLSTSDEADGQRDVFAGGDPPRLHDTRSKDRPLSRAVARGGSGGGGSKGRRRRISPYRRDSSDDDHMIVGQGWQHSSSQDDADMQRYTWQPSFLSVRNDEQGKDRIDTRMSSSKRPWDEE